MIQRRYVPILAALLALAMSTLPRQSSGAVSAADQAEPSIFLSWHAPFGEPGATDTLSADCDSTHADTLWLSFDPGHASPKFLAVSADILIHPAVGDSLASFWSRDYEVNPNWLRIESEPQPGLGYPMPYRTNGGGGWGLMRQGSATLVRWIYATPYSQSVAITRRTYAAARIIFHHPPSFEDRCRQPICIEWAMSELTFDIQNGRTYVRTGAHRFVSLNSPGGAVCEPYRKAASLHGWKTPE